MLLKINIYNTEGKKYTCNFINKIGCKDNKFNNINSNERFKVHGKEIYIVAQFIIIRKAFLKLSFNSGQSTSKIRINHLKTL